MALYRISLTALILQQYPYLVPKDAQNIAAALGDNYKSVQILTSDQITDYSSITGQPIFMQLSFDPLTYQDENGANVSLSGLDLPIAICEFTLEKQIVKTAIAGSKKRGTVKELINIGEYLINVRGCILSQDDTYPAADVRTFNAYMKANVPIPITHKLAGMLGITFMDVERGGMPPKPGFQNMQLFEIQALEDIPIQLTVTNPSNIS